MSHNYATKMHCYYITTVHTVQLKCNITLVLHSTLDPRELDTLYSHSDTHHNQEVDGDLYFYQ